LLRNFESFGKFELLHGIHGLLRRFVSQATMGLETFPEFVWREPHTFVIPTIPISVFLAFWLWMLSARVVGSVWSVRMATTFALTVAFFAVEFRHHFSHVVQ
jgi:hypothetical protein